MKLVGLVSKELKRRSRYGNTLYKITKELIIIIVNLTDKS